MATEVSVSNFVNVSVERYIKDCQTTVNTKFWLNNNLPSKIVNHGGEKIIYVPMQTAIPESAFQSAEGSANPTAGTPAFEKGYLYVKKITAPMRFTEETVLLNEGPEVIAKNLEVITKGTLQSHDMLREFQMHQPGTGVVATVLTGTTGTTSKLIPLSNVKWIRPGMKFDIYNSGSAVVTANAGGTEGLVTDVDPSANTITMTNAGNDSLVAGYVLYYAGTYVSSATIITTRNCNGLYTLINDEDTAFAGGALTMGFDRDTQNFAKAVCKYGSTKGTPEALTMQRIRQVFDSIETEWGQDLPDLGYMDFGSWNAYQECLKADSQGAAVAMPAEGGFPAGIAFIYNGHRVRFVSSRLAEASTILFPNTKHLIKYKGAAAGWDTMAGSFQKVPGYQIFERVYRSWENYGADAFKCHGRLNDVLAVS